MAAFAQLRDHLLALEDRNYGAYKGLRGSTFTDERSGLKLHFDRIQSDPFAPPSRILAFIDWEAAAFPDWTIRSPERRRALAHELALRLAEALGVRPPAESSTETADAHPSREGRSGRGSGESGRLELMAPGQEVLDQSAVPLPSKGRIESVEVRLGVGLPARGRRILGRAAAALLTEELPRRLTAALRFDAFDESNLRKQLEAIEDAVALRKQLTASKLVAFVADGACLPRQTGVDPRPLAGDRAISFATPDSLRVTLQAPNAGSVTGLGIPEGITLIVGGGFHGKSTLLRALELGIYDHRYGDGRERVVTREDAVSIRAEDGRSVSGVNISPFISGLPDGTDTRCFTTANASGSTSQAASIMEALEAGSRLLLIDEDTAASNFMIRDARMQALISADREPITPLLHRIRALYEETGTSAVLVMGGSGDYFAVADTVIGMDTYRPVDLTSRAKSLAEGAPPLPSASLTSPAFPAREQLARRPQPGSLDPSRGRRDISIKLRDPDHLQVGHELLQLGALSQRVSPGQSRALGEALACLHRHDWLEGTLTIQEAIDHVCLRFEEAGFDGLSSDHRGDLAAFRRQDLAAALNRLRTLQAR